jgi:hypothetical protein
MRRTRTDCFVGTISRPDVLEPEGQPHEILDGLIARLETPAREDVERRPRQRVSTRSRASCHALSGVQTARAGL